MEKALQSSKHQAMKEVIIKYSDSRVLNLLKSLAAHLNFSISEKQEPAPESTTQTPSNALDFVNKWGGFLKNTSTDDAKYDYLANKYK